MPKSEAHMLMVEKVEINISENDRELLNEISYVIDTPIQEILRQLIKTYLHSYSVTLNDLHKKVHDTLWSDYIKKLHNGGGDDGLHRIV